MPHFSGAAKVWLKWGAFGTRGRQALPQNPNAPFLAGYSCVWVCVLYNLALHKRFRWGQDVPILKEGELDIISHTTEQTQRYGIRLGTLLQAGDVVCLSGDMGAGKTMLSAGIGRGWGALSPLTSPTFNLVHEHSRAKDKQRLYHMDCYRLSSEADVDNIGWDDIMSGRGPVIIEWPERILEALPKERLWIELRVLEPTRRNLLFEGNNARYREVIRLFRQLTFGA